MATATNLPPQLTVQANDRLGLTIFFAVVMHSLIILGISFSGEDKPNVPEKLPGLEVTLVQSKIDKDIEDADFLAQENQEGGGRDKEAERAASPVEPLVATGQVGEVTQIFTQIFVPESSEKSDKELLTAEDSKDKLRSESDTKDLDTKKDLAATAQLVTINKEIAKQSAEIDQLREKFKKRKNYKYTAAAAMKAKNAQYEEMFRKEIERIGTLNFPDKAKRSNMSGDVRVAVTINKDGTLAGVKVTKFSGKKILDDAAVRFVKMAKFPPIPEDVVGKKDGLVIVRTFQFIPGGKGSKGRLKTRAN
jgi:protein TonB